MKLDDALLGLVIAIFGAAIVFLASGLKVIRNINYGAGFFPSIIGVGLMICGLVLIGRRVFAKGLQGPWIQFGKWSRSPRHIVNVILIPASVVIYILFSTAVGFFLLMTILLSVQIAWFTRRPMFSVGIALFVTLFLQEFFQGLMSVPLPWGVFEPFAGILTWM